jgi:hypothetical protein
MDNIIMISSNKIKSIKYLKKIIDQVLRTSLKIIIWMIIKKYN